MTCFLLQSPPIVPADVDVEFEVELLSAEDAPLPENLSIDEKIKHVDAKRERGNKQFQEGEFGAAEKL
jgi:hypothetical protein